MKLNYSFSKREIALILVLILVLVGLLYYRFVYLNISGQVVNRSADNMIKETMFRLNIGLTFNERWFAKWKVE